jgi:hypothetical protein
MNNKLLFKFVNVDTSFHTSKEDSFDKEYYLIYTGEGFQQRKNK